MKGSQDSTPARLQRSIPAAPRSAVAPIAGVTNTFTQIAA
jgi:hypothetical protein